MHVNNIYSAQLQLMLCMLAVRVVERVGFVLLDELGSRIFCMTPQTTPRFSSYGILMYLGPPAGDSYYSIPDSGIDDVEDGRRYFAIHYTVILGRGAEAKLASICTALDLSRHKCYPRRVRM